MGQEAMPLTDDAPIAPSKKLQTDLFDSPSWFPEGFDQNRSEFLFVAADRSELASQSFLDWRWNRSGATRQTAGTTAMIARLSPQNPRPCIVWHTGFCCSTLLAKALDRPGRNLSLCEPQVLVDVVDAKRAGKFARDLSPAIPQLAFHLLSRGFVPEERVTLKPAPAANALLRDAATQTSGPMLFLFSDCRSFLVSICKLGENGRKYVRSLFLAMLHDDHVQAQWPAPKLLSLSDLELAAIVWHMQIAEFLRSWPLLGAGRAASLDCDAFLALPVDALSRLDDFFSLGVGKNHLEEAVSGPLFHRNAKTGEDSFDASRRLKEHAQTAQQLGSDLDRIVARSYAICRTTPLGTPLPEPLVPIDKVYCP
jgi:hypothetical protein